MGCAEIEESRTEHPCLIRTRKPDQRMKKAEMAAMADLMTVTAAENDELEQEQDIALDHRRSK